MRLLILLLFPVLLSSQTVEFPNQILYSAISDNWLVMHENWKGVFHEDLRKKRTDIVVITPRMSDNAVVGIDDRTVIEYKPGRTGYELARVNKTGAIIMLYWFTDPEPGVHYYSLFGDGSTFMMLCSDWDDQTLQLANSVRQYLIKIKNK